MDRWDHARGCALSLLEELRAVRLDPNATDADKAAALDKMRADYDRISARNQLREPLGEKAYAELVKNGGVAQAMLEHGLEPAKPGSDEAMQKAKQVMLDNGLKPRESDGPVAALKALLGKKAAEAAMADPDALEAAITEFGIKSLMVSPDLGVEYTATMMGLQTEAKLTAQQFLQTGGNETQIRNKARLNKEINAGRASETETHEPDAEHTPDPKYYNLE